MFAKFDFFDIQKKEDIDHCLPPEKWLNAEEINMIWIRVWRIWLNKHSCFSILFKNSHKALVKKRSCKLNIFFYFAKNTNMKKQQQQYHNNTWKRKIFDVMRTMIKQNIWKIWIFALNCKSFEWLRDRRKTAHYLNSLNFIYLFI